MPCPNCGKHLEPKHIQKLSPEKRPKKSVYCDIDCEVSKEKQIAKKKKYFSSKTNGPKLIKIKNKPKSDLYSCQANRVAIKTKTVRTLGNDICRCLDDGCSERETCLRWIQRGTGIEKIESLRPYDLPLNESCPNKIE